MGWRSSGSSMPSSSLMTWAVIIVSAILSWLFAFDVINHRNRFVNQLAGFLDAVTQPLLAPFRRIIPPLGGIDISPIVVLLLLHFARDRLSTTRPPAY